MTWHLSIDTGGTFTDGLARNPAGEVRRAKVLSTGAIRARVLAVAGPGQYRLAQQWHLPDAATLTGFYLRQAGEASETGPQVIAFDPATGLLRSSAALPGLEPGATVELFTGEEAPVLAARLLTGTPPGQAFPPLTMRLGSTRGTNALLERKGARVALLVTAGLPGLLEIGNQQRPDLFALDIRKPAPLYDRLIEVPARMDAQGQEIAPLLPDHVQELVQQVLASGCDAVAIALLHAYRNPAHERALAAALRQAGLAHVSCSHQLAPAIRLLPRAQTTVVNAFLAPVIEDYLAGVQHGLAQAPLKVMTSAGGLVDARHFHPKDSLLSGPAGGVVGAATLARQTGHPRILTLDMGGTSTDVARYDGAYDYRYELAVGDARLLSPALAIETVAAGGGSICRFDGQRLSVGPDSAGAQPGPACYGAGGPLTLTDVNLLLGRLDPATFGIPLDEAAARAALAALRGEAVISEEELLQGFLDLAHETMAGAIRRISIRQGYDPAAYALLAFGGAGGQHACAVAGLLGIRRVIVPYEAGILSASGIGTAAITRQAQAQVLRPLAEVDLAARFARLEAEALAALAAEGPGGQISRRSLLLRFHGQNHSLEIPYAPGGPTPEATFRMRYEALFGHWLDQPSLELEAIRVVATLAGPDLPPLPPVPTSHHPHADRHTAAGPVYDWENLGPGAHLAGPALLAGRHATVVVPAGWSLQLDGGRNAILQATAPQATVTAEAEAAISLSLFAHRFESIAQEMGALLERTSFSVNVKERLDFSCALLDAAGTLVVNAPHIPVHLGSLGVCVRQVCAALPLGPGDVAITNHPGYGGSHLPDITLVAPVFVGETLAGYVANRAHHAELGGKRPGSMPADARHLAEEGVVIPPTYLVRAGQMDRAGIAAHLQAGPWPTRALAENLADLDASLASIRAGVDALTALCQEHGLATVQARMADLKAYAAQHMRQRLAAFPPGTYAAQEFLDDGSLLQVQISLAGGEASLDFSGTSPTHPGNFNANPAIVTSVVMYVLKLLAEAGLPLNEGLMEPVHLYLPPGSMLNPAFPPDPAACPAVVGGNVETSQRLTDTLLKALGVAACSQGTMNNFLFGHESLGYYETIGGGTGAGPDFAGAHGVHQHMTNTRITDPEILEFRYPVRLEQLALRPGSGGKGRWPGGNGIIRQVRFLQDMEVTLLTQHRTAGPYGLAGGEAGQPGQQYWLRAAEGDTLPLPGCISLRLRAGDAIRIETPGGGGYGNPRK